MNLAAFNRPAQILGGDYFDFVDFKDGKHGLVIADVSGHGVSAGMFMSSLQTAFHTLVPEADSPFVLGVLIVLPPKH
jgi:sigma-B regulation protein RsbU (phosphoserine phosphatase)